MIQAMKNQSRGLEALRKSVVHREVRPVRLRRAASVIRLTGGYRWVGIYKAGTEEIAVVAWSGTGEPAYPRFPVTQGLCGDAVRRRETVLVNDVTNDPRYLTTFGSTRSEIVVPIPDRGRTRVAGLIDVESERPDAFGQEDRLFLERCAAEMAAADVFHGGQP
jgi:putative methionine-R-sulfoxide reductase with GAF domain